MTRHSKQRDTKMQTPFDGTLMGFSFRESLGGLKYQGYERCAAIYTPTVLMSIKFVLTVTSSCLCKNLEGACFPFQVKAIEDGIDNAVHTFHVYKADHRPRPPSHFHKTTLDNIRSAQLLPQMFWETFHRCFGKLKNANRSGRSFSSCLTIVGYAVCQRSLKQRNAARACLRSPAR